MRPGVRTSPGATTRSPGDDVGAASPDVLSGRHARKMLTACRRRVAVSSTMTTASAPSGSGAPVAISTQLPRVTRSIGASARERASDQSKPQRSVARGVRGVGCNDGVAVHRRSRERRHVDSRDDVGRGDAAQRIVDAHTLRSRDRSDRRREAFTRFVERNRRCERSHSCFARMKPRDHRVSRRRRHRFACCTMCRVRE